MFGPDILGLELSSVNLPAEVRLQHTIKSKFYVHVRNISKIIKKLKHELRLLIKQTDIQ